MKIKTADGKSSKRVFGLIAGAAGIGKTTQITTFPKKETLGISVEDGFLSIEGSGYAYVEAKSYDDVEDTLNNLPKWVKYVYIDSMSEIYDLIKKDCRNKFTVKQNFQKFDEINSMLFHIIRLAKSLNVTVFFVSHVKTEKNGLTLEHELCYDGKLPAEIKKQFDVVVHMDTIEDDEGKNKRVLITSPEISNVAKIRVSPWLNIKVNDYEEPNLYKLTQKLLGKTK